MKRLSTFTRFGVLLLGAALAAFGSCKPDDDLSGDPGDLPDFVTVEGAGRVTVTVNEEKEFMQVAEGDIVSISAIPTGKNNAYAWISNHSFGYDLPPENIAFRMPASGVSITVKFFALSANAPAVEIGGVTWAARNVDKRGAFSAAPWKSGGLYAFAEAQTACPAGWRTPRIAEIDALKNTPGTWGNVNGINGYLLESGSNVLFLPTSGYKRPEYSDTSGNPNNYGYFWGDSYVHVPEDDSAIFEQILAFGIGGFDGGFGMFAGGTRYIGDITDYGLSVRCVKE